MSDKTPLTPPEGCVLEAGYDYFYGGTERAKEFEPKLDTDNIWCGACGKWEGISSMSLLLFFKDGCFYRRRAQPDFKPTTESEVMPVTGDPIGVPLTGPETASAGVGATVPLEQLQKLVDEWYEIALDGRWNGLSRSTYFAVADQLSAIIAQQKGEK